MALEKKIFKVFPGAKYHLDMANLEGHGFKNLCRGPRCIATY